MLFALNGVFHGLVAADFLETLFGLAIDGKLDKTCQPPFLQVMVWMTDLESKTYLAAIPKGVQLFLAALLSPIAKLLGYRAMYAKYAANYS